MAVMMFTNALTRLNIIFGVRYEAVTGLRQRIRCITLNRFCPLES
jgi:hypothetical protein